MSLSYLDDAGLSAVWAKVKSFFKKNSAVYITLTTSGNMPTVETQGVTWTITSQVDNNGDTLTNSELYDTVLNGADVYIYLASSDYPLGANVKWGHASVEKVFSSIGEETEIYVYSHTQFFDYRSMGGASYDIVPVVFYGRITRNAGLMNYTSGKLSYVSRADDVKYDNSYSGISANNVQDAIDSALDSYNTVYDNTSSGLTATNVQDAIDEVAASSGGGDPQYARGDSVNLEDGVFAGSWYQPKTLFFFIPLPKGTANTGSVSISGKWLVRAGTGGRIIDNVALNTVGTVTVSKKATGVMVRVVLSTASTTYTTDQACTAYGSSSAKITFNT